MKKTILSLMLLAGTFMAKAQDGHFPQHEVRFNIFNVIALGSVEVGYEYYLDKPVGGVGCIDQRYL